MVDIEQSCLVVIDIQGKLSQLMVDKDNLIQNVCILIKAAKLLEVPILWCQQNPKSLGETISPIAENLTGIKPINKISFSSWGCESFKKQLTVLNRPQVLLCGIEAHVCIYQTARDLKAIGKDVEVIADAVSSRTSENKHIAFERMQIEGIGLISSEMVLFDWLKNSEHPSFRRIIKLIK